MLAVGLAGLVGPGRESGEGLQRAAVGEPPGPAHCGHQLRGPDRAQAGQAGRQPGGVDTGQGGVPGLLVAGPLNLSRADQAHLGGDLGGQVVDRDGAIAVPQRDRLGGGHPQRLGLGGAQLPAAGL
jgi:hypothetical protein